jgi:hypothetical protein
MLFTGFSLAGEMNGVELARAVGKLWPAVRLVVVSSPESGALRLPEDAVRMRKPWLPLDVLMQAHRAVRQPDPLVV